MHRTFSFPSLHCYSTMDVLQMQMQHWNKYQNDQDLSLPSGSDILPIYWSCRASAIYDLPINLRYIDKRIPALRSTRRGWRYGRIRPCWIRLFEYPISHRRSQNRERQEWHSCLVSNYVDSSMTRWSLLFIIGFLSWPEAETYRGFLPCTIFPNPDNW